MQSHAQYELRHYLHLIKASRDIVTKIHPHYEMMYPAGVCQMTALDPELSNAPLAMKIEFCDRILQTQPSGIAKVAPPRPARPCFTTQRFYNLFTRDIKQRRGSRKIFFFLLIGRASAQESFSGTSGHTASTFGGSVDFLWIPPVNVTLSIFFMVYLIK